jgi:hypothetical protein
LEIGQRLEVEAKGLEKPLVLHEVRGVAGEYNLFLLQKEEELTLLEQEIAVRWCVFEGKHISQMAYAGRLVKLSGREGELYSDNPAPLRSNIRIQLLEDDREELFDTLYGKVMEHLSGRRSGFSVRFASTLPESVLYKLLRRGGGPTSTTRLFPLPSLS